MVQTQSQTIQNLPPETKSQAVEAARPAAQLMERATSHRTETQSHDTSSDRSGKEALMHTHGAPGKAQEAMSPTDHHKGQTHSQNRSRGMER